MSGGSYDYLCFKAVEQISDEQLQRMADRLAGLAYAIDAAAETENLLLTIRQYQNRLSVMTERLRGVWQAIEWWDSNDWGEDAVKNAIEKYRRS